MGRRVPKIVFHCVLVAVTLAILAAPPLFLGLVLNGLAAGQPATCGGG
jgi:hypothetical protein